MTTEDIQVTMCDLRYDTKVIRPQLNDNEVELRGQFFNKHQARKMKKALLTLHTLELMAINIYKFQICHHRLQNLELKRKLIAAMCNEMTHYQDFQTKLYEFGFKPSKFRWCYWLVGFAIGFASRLLGTKAILKTGIWVESKAVRHYDHLLKFVEWDPQTREIIKKNQADEFGHIDNWKSMLESLNYEVESQKSPLQEDNKSVSKRQKEVLFICTGNSCRSQMSEAFLRQVNSNKYEAYSAGTNPVTLSSRVVKVMGELGIDMSHHFSKGIDELADMDFDIVVTVCDKAKEACPTFPADRTKVMHWSFPDPAEAQGSEDEILDFFRTVRDQIREKIEQEFGP